VLQASKSIDSRITTARVAINGMLADSALQARLAAHGHDAARLQQGQALLLRAEQLQRQQQAQSSAAVGSYEAYAVALKQLYRDYIKQLAVARLAFKEDRAARQKLALDGRRKEAGRVWLGQARQFYANALNDEALLQRLGQYSVTRAGLEASKQQLEAVERQTMLRQQKRASAQHSVKLRDEALQELEAWMRKFRRVAQLALEDEPGMLAHLGVAKGA
jgi:hypothetical protein